MIDLIDSEILELNKKADEDLKDVFDELDRICLVNSERVLSAFIENQVSYTDFADINGYGNYDAGRDKLEKIFATVLGCEDALVRPQIMSAGPSADHVRYQRFVSGLFCHVETWRYDDLSDRHAL